MIKTLAVGVWVIGVTLAAVFFAVTTMGPKGEAVAKGAATADFAMQKTPAVSIPMIANGAVQGYVTAQFAYMIDPYVLKQLPIPPDVFLEDEAFRRIYADSSIDFRHLEKIDLSKLTAEILKTTNERLGADVIKSILIQDFNFVSKEDVDH